MDSRGSTNGAEVNAFAVNTGNFIVDVPASAQTSVTPSLSLIRRIAARSVDVLAVAGNVMLTARRRATAAAQVTVDGAALLARRAAARATSQATIDAGAALTRRITALSTATITIDGKVFLAWRYLRRATPNRIMRIQPVRAFVVGPELRRLIVPRDISVMRLPREQGAMP
ncbi:hypothetical protein [Agrobacterium tumefaciens]|uniref:hypothetical protein n=1 Tax=Agrobacterium tumefaciens TaxID=358 RepID=UPI0021D13E41|nr:hypothetical protein [Agrobacterium tumefaciens]UXS01090.1 hypothetical protein FY156_06065 [Agrobacterium tumefaciens]